MAKVDLKSDSVAYVDQGVDEPGYYLLEGEQEEDENGVIHETNMTPGDRVYPAPDGKGFQTTEPEEGDE